MREHESNTPMKKELYIRLDVHKDSVTVAVAQGGRERGAALWNISNDFRSRPCFCVMDIVIMARVLGQTRICVTYAN